MKSIRRSLVLWFLLLAIVSLATVGFVIDRVVRQAVAGREKAAVDLLERQFELQKQKELDQFDKELVEEAKSISRASQLLYSNGINQVYEPQNYTFLVATGFGPFNVLPATTTMMLSAPGPLQWSVYQEFLIKRVYDDRPLLGKLNDDEHYRGLFQIHTAFHKVILSKSLNEMPLPEFDRTELSKTLPNTSLPEEIERPDGTYVRRVIHAQPVLLRYVSPPRVRGGPGGGGGGVGGGNNQNSRDRDRERDRDRDRDRDRPPPRSGNGNPPPPSNPPPRQNSDVIRFFPRIYVQTAIPVSIIEAKFRELSEDRDHELSRIRSESAAAINQSRWILLAVASGGIASLLLGSTLIISRGLRPVDRLSEAVSLVSEKDFRLPVSSREMSLELLPVHARLTTTLDALRRAFEREKQAVADISHELRTPVASLAATIDVSLRKPRSAEQYKATLEECREINRQLGRLVERVMTLANLDAGNVPSTTGPVNASEIVGECVAVIRPLAEAHNLKLTSDVKPELLLTTDREKVREVLMNLLHNAVEYTPAGGVIEITAKSKGPGVEFRVRDTGIGMTPDVQEKIFERFYRALIPAVRPLASTPGSAWRSSRNTSTGSAAVWSSIRSRVPGARLPSRCRHSQRSYRYGSRIRSGQYASLTR
ncbi:MAG: HAMP domain-containing sensor histidine kinase [Gemmataceae bacterium]